MDGHRQIDGGTGPTAMTDEAIDREIASLLASEPSPEFLARVRTRVAQEPEPGMWRWSWIVATAGAAALVIVAVMVWPSRESAVPNGAPVQAPQVAAAGETVAPRAASPAPEPRRTPRAARAVAVAASPDRASEIDLPEVLIAENEARTFASLVMSIRQRHFDAAVPVAPDPDTLLDVQELAEPSPVLVEPIDIEPIVRLAVIQPEGERP